MSTRIALAQVSSSEDREETLRRCLEAIDQAAAEEADLVVFPEVVLDRFFPAERGDDCRRRAHQLAETIPGPTTDALRGKAKEHGLVIVFNLYEKVEDGEGTRYYDSSPVIDADGTLLGLTRMVHITDYEGFHEQEYYDAGDTGAPVYDTAAGRIGVAICYDRHYPEYMRALSVSGAELVVVPQAGAVGEWPGGMFTAELRTAAFQNGYYAALVNRVGRESGIEFAGGSFVTDAEGAIVAEAPEGEEATLIADLDFDALSTAPAQALFNRHRRPECYSGGAAETRLVRRDGHSPAMAERYS